MPCHFARLSLDLINLLAIFWHLVLPTNRPTYRYGSTGTNGGTKEPTRH